MTPRNVPAKALFLAALSALLLVPVSARAHQERDTEFPDGSGHVPAYRSFGDGPRLVVCTPQSRARIAKIDRPRLRRINQALLQECEYRHIQDAVDGVRRRGTTIYVLPGVYRENPSRRQPSCARTLPQDDGGPGAPVLSYEEQYRCPHAQNLIGIFGDDPPLNGKRACDAPVCDLQIEGTGRRPGDVVITGGFKRNGDWLKLNGIRGDRADGLYLKNFTIQLFEFNAVYILETDGFVIDEVVARYNDEYGYLTYAVDHGLHKNCEAYLNGEAAVYPGSASDINKDSTETGPLDRPAVEITGCSFHHSALGMAGTAGNSLYVHDNDFFKNSAGVTVDSVFPNHPGLPQNHGWFENNRIFSNNVNYYEKYLYSGKCDAKPAKRGYRKGTVCPVVPAPVGTGMLIAGGSYNFVRNNAVYDNWRAGFMQFGVPAAIREEVDPTKQFDTSHFNFYVDNRLGFGPRGEKLPNGIDVWWDDQGEGNCWQGNLSANDEITSNTLYPGGLPDCDSGGSALNPFNPVKQAPLVPCATYDRDDPLFRDPPGCGWFQTPDKPDR
jgi:hypothetical protein